MGNITLHYTHTMGRTRGAKKAQDAKTAIASGSTSPPPPTYTAADLLEKAESLLTAGEAELAAKFAARAYELVTAADGKGDGESAEKEKETLRCNEVLGMCALELGEEAEAKRLFELCRASSATSLLYLAQLADSPEEAVGCFKAAVDLLSTRIDLSEGSFSNGKDKEWSFEERETRVQISRALVGMTELYLTALCMEPDAEARCTEYLDLAVRVDAGGDINPEIYSTLASVRLSQCRNADALAALQKSYSIWKPLPPDSVLVPPFSSRLNLARLLIECEAFEDAIEVLEGLEDEDDEEYEVLYLIGLVNWMLGEKVAAIEEARKREFYIDSREALERFLQIEARKQVEADPEMLAQVEEMLGTLESQKGITSKDVEEQAARLEGSNGHGNSKVDDEDAWEDDDDVANGDEEMS